MKGALLSTNGPHQFFTSGSGGIAYSSLRTKKKIPVEESFFLLLIHSRFPSLLGPNVKWDKIVKSTSVLFASPFTPLKHSFPDTHTLDCYCIAVGKGYILLLAPISYLSRLTNILSTSMPTKNRDKKAFMLSKFQLKSYGCLGVITKPYILINYLWKPIVGLKKTDSEAL